MELSQPTPGKCEGDNEVDNVYAVANALRCEVWTKALEVGNRELDTMSAPVCQDQRLHKPIGVDGMKARQVVRDIRWHMLQPLTRL